MVVRIPRQIQTQWTSHLPKARTHNAATMLWLIAQKKTVNKINWTHCRRCRSTAGLCWSLWSCPSGLDSSLLCYTGLASAQSRPRALENTERSGRFIDRRCINQGLNHCLLNSRGQLVFHLRGFSVLNNIRSRGIVIVMYVYKTSSAVETKHVRAEVCWHVWATWLMSAGGEVDRSIPWDTHSRPEGTSWRDWSWSGVK